MSWSVFDVRKDVLVGVQVKLLIIHRKHLYVNYVKPSKSHACTEARACGVYVRVCMDRPSIMQKILVNHTCVPGGKPTLHSIVVHLKQTQRRVFVYFIVK